MTSALVALLLHIGLQDQFDGAEIGDATQAMTFESGGKYVYERSGKEATHAKGTWTTSDSGIDVKITSCKGAGCSSALGKSFHADVDVVSDRAMTVKASPPDAPLSSGSYYCHYQGCEKRSGVAIVAHGTKPAAMKYLLDYLIDKNRSRDKTVVWWQTRRIEDKQSQTKLEYCQRDEARAKAIADATAKELAELPWIGALTPQPGGKDCLYEVRLVVADGVTLPAKK